MDNVTTENLQRDQIPEAARVASRAFVTNPLSVAAYRGQGKRQRLIAEAMFKVAFERTRGQVLVARWGKPIVGVIGMANWPDCQVSTLQDLLLLPRVLWTLKSLTPRVLMMSSMLRSQDPKEPHWHLAPIAVLPRLQGQGIGSRLLERFCEHVDGRKMPAYLDTDRPESVRLYERFGFTVMGEGEVYGARLWRMWRPRPPQSFTPTGRRAP